MDRGGQKFLFPVRALSKVFRAKYLECLQALLDAGPARCAQLIWLS